MRIFAEVFRGGASKDSGVVNDDIFWLFWWLPGARNWGSGWG